MENHYETLEMSPSASAEQIRERSRLLLNAWHPDKFQNPRQKAKAEEKTKKINEAYSVLCDQAKRAQYDKARSSEYAKRSEQETGAREDYERAGYQKQQRAGQSSYNARRSDEEHRRSSDADRREEGSQSVGREREATTTAQGEKEADAQHRRIGVRNIIGLVIAIAFVFGAIRSLSNQSNNITDLGNSSVETPHSENPIAVPPTLVLNADVDRESLILSLLKYFVADSRYDPSKHVLHKYLDGISVSTNSSTLRFNTGMTSGDDDLDLAVDLIFLGALFSHAGESGDWGLSRIEVFSPGPLGSSATLTVEGYSNIVGIAKNEISIYQVMKPEVNWGNLPTPNPTATVGLTIQNACPQGCTERKVGCDIKGNISKSSGEKIFHMPGQKYYNDTVVDINSGERWFCTEDEARKNGYRRSYQ